MNRVEVLVARLSDRLLERERAVMMGLSVTGESWWSVASRQARRRWVRGMVKSRQSVVNGFEQDGRRLEEALRVSCAQFLTDVADLTWASLVEELMVVEKTLGRRYVGAANAWLNRTPKQAFVDGSVNEMGTLLTEATDLFVGSMTATVDDAVTGRKSGRAMVKEVRPLWGRVVWTATSQIRRVEFEMVNALRADAMQNMNEVVAGR